MESHKHYSQSETDFLLSCAETDENEVLDYKEFVERFHEPAKVRAMLCFCSEVGLKHQLQSRIFKSNRTEYEVKRAKLKPY